jgi:LAS superfamily LD-carboxypeptidase LdcB
MISALPAIALGGLLLVASSDRVPTLNTAPTCAGANGDLSATRTVPKCRESEQQARDALAAQWSNFPAADKAECVAETSIGGFPSYVQVLTCLEMARDARKLPANFD